ncbi:MAG: EAL domain-containing protein [Xanthobacteraceae bacterium]|nr:EAL domain-containing protein [Xanthobacteraceae bacterium]
MESRSLQTFRRGVIRTVCGGWLLSSLTVAVATPVHALQISDMLAVADPADEVSPIWELVIGGFVVIAFLVAMFIWVSTALRSAQRTNARREFFVTSALNNLSQGIVMLNAKHQVAYCNNRFLEIYGFSRSDLRRNMAGYELMEMWSQRGKLACGLDEFLKTSRHPDGHLFAMPDGRWILVKNTNLANGGMVSTHEDVTTQHRLSKELATAKGFLESVVDNIPVCVAAKSIEDGRYILANRAFSQFLNTPHEEIIGRTAGEIFAPDLAVQFDQKDHDAIVSPVSVQHNCTVDLGQGPRELVSKRLIVRNAQGEPEYLIVAFEDITGVKAMAREVQNTKKFLELVVDNIPAALTVKRVSDGKFVLANRAAQTIFNRTRTQIIDHTVEDVHPEAAAKFMLKRDDAAIRKGGLVTEEHPITVDNALRLFATRRVTVNGDDGEPQYLIKTSEDITERRETESRMAYMAYHDGLTELPNRAAFLLSMEQLIDACGDAQEEFAVLSIDLDGFKDINDVFGHEIGDKLLIEVARRIEKAAEAGVVARLGGDEYGLLIDGKQPDAAKELAQQVSKAITEEFHIDGKILRVGVTTGISIFPRNGRDGAALLANADAALSRAKARARGSVSFFEVEMDQQIRDRRALHQDLANALRKGELSLHYQPQARARHTLSGDDVVGFEALVRWRHPTRGFVPPGEFIPLAEESGVIVELGEWILREACREAASWPRHLQIAVNLSPAQFMHGDVVSLVHSILLETGLTPGRLELEITEGVLIEDFDRGLSLLRRLKALGVHIAMDDFGSGYSSLTYLQAFPFDKIKIDRAFVMNLGNNPQSATIIRAVVGLGHGLGISIVAEGVETQDQLKFLAFEGCDQVQGYFLGKPGVIDTYAAWVGRTPGIQISNAGLGHVRKVG